MTEPNSTFLPVGPMTAMSRVSVTREIEWSNTDAAGRWHYATAFALFEAAEVQLIRELGYSINLFAYLPRVHVEADIRKVLEFGDSIDATVTAVETGRSSITYVLMLSTADEEVATGRIVAVLIDEQGRTCELPVALRTRLADYAALCRTMEPS